jgi:site-specific recombinase XerD
MLNTSDGRPRLLFTGSAAELTIGGVAAVRLAIRGQPILIDGHAKVVWPVTNYLAHLRVFGRAQSTIDVYARQLLDYWHFLHDSRLAWELADDSFLRLWREHLGEIRKIKRSTFNTYLSTVVGFYKHAQAKRWGHNIIGVNDLEKGHAFRISMETKTRKDGTGYEVSSLRYRTAENPEPYFPPAPVIDAITVTIATSKRAALSERDLIIVEFMRRVGLRRSEVLRITRHQIPTLDAIDEFEDDQLIRNAGVDEPASPAGMKMEIVSSKSGGRIDVVYVPPSLMRRTREWADTYRRELVTLRRGTGHIAKDPDELFLSWKTGTALKGQSFTNMFKSAARRAQETAEQEGGIDPRHSEARPHHLRGEAITNALVDVLETGMNQTEALLYAQIFGRHKNFGTTERYLNFAHMLQDERKRISREVAQQRDATVQQQTIRDHCNILLASLANDLAPGQLELLMRLVQMLREQSVAVPGIDAVIVKS